MRILVADDDAVLTHLLKHRLTALGHEVQVARDALQAWHSVQRNPPDLVLLDINMPGGTGVVVLQRLRNNLRVSGVPVIVITATEEESTLQQIREQHPEALLRKPIQFEELALVINRLLVDRELGKADRLVPHRGGP